MSHSSFEAKGVNGFACDVSPTWFAYFWFSVKLDDACTVPAVFPEYFVIYGQWFSSERSASLRNACASEISGSDSAWSTSRGAGSLSGFPSEWAGWRVGSRWCSSSAIQAAASSSSSCSSASSECSWACCSPSAASGACWPSSAALLPWSLKWWVIGLKAFSALQSVLSHHEVRGGLTWTQYHRFRLFVSLWALFLFLSFRHSS